MHVHVIPNSRLAWLAFIIVYPNLSNTTSKMENMLFPVLTLSACIAVAVIQMENDIVTF